MYFWLIGSINPFLFFFLPKKLRSQKNFLIASVGAMLSFHSLFFENLNLNPLTEIKLRNFFENQDEVRNSRIWDIQPSKLGEKPSNSSIIEFDDHVLLSSLKVLDSLKRWIVVMIDSSKNLPEKLDFCLRLSGVSGQVQDLVLRFYVFRLMFFGCLLPIYYLFRVLGCKSYGLVQILRIFSFFAAFLLLSQGKQTFGLIRVFLWAGPLSMISSALGFFGLRAFFFKCLCLSVFFPGFFSEKLGLVLWIIFSGIFIIAKLPIRKITEFFAISIFIAVIFSASNSSFGFVSIMLSPWMEGVGFVFAMLQFFGLESLGERFLQLGVGRICESEIFYHLVITDKNLMMIGFRVLASLFLLFFCPKFRSPSW